MRLRRMTLSLAACWPLATWATAEQAAPAGVAVAATRPAPASALTVRLPIESYQLSNGLEVLLVERKQSPIVAVNVAYHIGSKDEAPDKRGMAHLFEHMMFKGSKHVGPEMHTRMVDAVGGRDNAFTTEDITVYQNEVPKDQLGFVLRLEAERMQNLVVLDKTIASEREVVKNERHWRVDDNPVEQALLLLQQSAFRVHPYRWSPIGENRDLDSVTPAECQAFFQRYYQPSNATLILVGDFDRNEAKKQIEETLGQLPANPTPARAYTQEPAQAKKVELRLTKKVQLPFVVGGFRTPAGSSPDMPALEVLSRVLGEGRSSRLYRRLVRKDKVAVEVGGLVQPLEDPGLLIVYAAHLPRAKGEAVKQALFEEVARVRNDGVVSVEVERAKNQLLSEHVRKLENVEGLASELAMAQYVYGGWKTFGERLSRTAAVTADDVARVAKLYLVEKNLTTVQLDPEAPPQTLGAPAPAKESPSNGVPPPPESQQKVAPTGAPR